MRETTVNRRHQKLIHETDQNINPAGVEAHIRNKHNILAAGSTLDHLTLDTSVSKTHAAAAAQKEQPGYLADLGQAFGLERDNLMWEALLLRARNLRHQP